MYTPRLIASRIEKTSKSILLLGPRQVGKSTLIHAMRPELTFNLSDETLFIELNSNLESFKDKIEERPWKSVFIDEVQRLPELLNLVQYYIDQKKGMRFFLTGSSARKLRRGGANLLPGRVLNFNLGALTAGECDYRLNTEEVLNYGTLPGVHFEKEIEDRQDVLRSYGTSYLKEEIQQESLVRSLPSFARFFQVACTEVGKFIDYSKLSKMAKISRHSIPRFFEILEDTLIGFRIYPFEPALEGADLIKHPKFYLFDNGVYNGLMGNFKASEDRKGILMEQLIFNQIQNSCWARNKKFSASSFRTRGGLEIDFIFSIDDDVFPVEVKASESVNDADLRGLLDFKKYYSPRTQPFLLHGGKKESKREGVWILPWQSGMKKLGL